MHVSSCKVLEIPGVYMLKSSSVIPPINEIRTCCKRRVLPQKTAVFKTGYGLFDILHTRLKVCTPRNRGQAFLYRILWQNV
jgi:hypothetical protein